MLEQLFGENQHEKFLSQNWPDIPLLAAKGRVPIAQLGEWAIQLEPTQSIPKMLGDVQVWSGVGSRRCSGSEALELYSRGCCLYVPHVESVVPSLVEPIRLLEMDLGVPAGSGHCSIFAGKKGAMVPAHCDHDFGFNLLLVGRKSWKISTDSRRYFPLRGHQVGRDFADDGCGRGVLPPAHMPKGEIFDQRPGGCVFLPAGVWHQTKLEEDCISLDFAIDPPRIADIMTQALRSLLNNDERFRAPFDTVARAWWDSHGFPQLIEVAHSITKRKGE